MRVVTSLMIVLIFLSPVLLVHNSSPANTTSDGMIISAEQSWLNGWTFRKSHTMIGASGAGANYTVRFTVHYGSGSDAGSNVYLDGLCKNDFGDIRFTDDDGVTPLDYWTQSVVPSDHAVFWVKIADNLDTDQVIFINYGNPSASSESDGPATFQFFDDFESGTFDRWDSVNAWSIDTTYSVSGTYCALGSGGVLEPFLMHNMNQTGSFMVHMDARTFSDFNTFPVLLSSDEGTCYPCAFGWTNALYNDGSYHNWPSNSEIGYNTWYDLQIGVDMTNNKLRGWKDDSYMGEVDFASDSGILPSRVTALRPAPGTQASRLLAVDNVFIRKWLPVGLSHGAWGSLESTTQTSPPTTTNPTTAGSPPTFDIILILTVGGGAIIIIAIVLICRARGPTSQGESSYNW